MKNKKVLIICSIVIIIASISALIYLFVKDDNKPQNNIIEGIKLPENQEILKDKTT